MVAHQETADLILNCSCKDYKHLLCKKCLSPSRHCCTHLQQTFPSTVLPQASAQHFPSVSLELYTPENASTVSLIWTPHTRTRSDCTSSRLHPGFAGLSSSANALQQGPLQCSTFKNPPSSARVLREACIELLTTHNRTHSWRNSYDADRSLVQPSVANLDPEELKLWALVASFPEKLRSNNSKFTLRKALRSRGFHKAHGKFRLKAVAFEATGACNWRCANRFVSSQSEARALHICDIVLSCSFLFSYLLLLNSCLNGFMNMASRLTSAGEYYACTQDEHPT